MEVSKFECDACGDTHGHRTDMVEVPIRRESDEWIPPRDEVLHVCYDHDYYDTLLTYVTGGVVNRWCVRRDRTVAGYLSATHAFVPLDEDCPSTLHRAAEAVEEVF